MTPTSPRKADPADLASLFDAIVQADNGDAQSLTIVRECFRDAPNLADTVSGLAYNAEASILVNVPAGAQELFRQQARNLRRQLREEGTGTALERMLIRRISLDYLATLQAELQRALAPGELRSLELSRFYEQQADRAHRRFLASVESLSRIRKLMAPIAQINIADQQVNVAGNVTTGKGAGADGPQYVEQPSCPHAMQTARTGAGGTGASPWTRTRSSPGCWPSMGSKPAPHDRPRRDDAHGRHRPAVDSLNPSWCNAV